MARSVPPSRVKPGASKASAVTSPPRTVKPSRLPEKGGFDAEAYLASTEGASKVVRYRAGEVIFAQGEPGMDVRYVQKGAIKISVLSRIGKEAVVALLCAGRLLR